MNLIADALKRKTRHRYQKCVFAHLYAGKSSPFFYLKWQTTYRKFGQRIRDAFGNGYCYIANFDLAAFYDSIDHHVLSYFLKMIGIDEDTVEFLLDCLTIWTSSTWSTGPQNIYHKHGIPQGPLASGMLSEAVLQHLDHAGEQGHSTIYLRYVDDIKILAKSEDELRRKLIKLDISSKEIGLFPQTAKINIRQISDPSEEIKSVSLPPEPALRPTLDQKKLIDRILELSRNGRIDSANSTKFRYLLAKALPTHRLNARLMKVLRNYPHFGTSVCTYIAHYNKIPKKLAMEIIDYLQHQELYHAINGAVLRACLGRMGYNETAALGLFCANRLFRPKWVSIPVQPSYKEALIAWALSANTITFAEFDALVAAEPDWWVKKCALRELTDARYGLPTYTDVINRSMRAAEQEVARIAAARLVQDNLKLAKPYGDVSVMAKHVLREAKLIRAVGQSESRINEILSYIIKRAQTSYDWKVFFGMEHAHAEHMMIMLKRNRETNIDAFLVQLDSFCDLVTREIYKRLRPGKQCPAYGHAIKDAMLSSRLPDTMKCLQTLHDLRLESAMAHPKTQKTGNQTRRLKHRDYYKIRNDLIAAFDEFEAIVVP